MKKLIPMMVIAFTALFTFNCTAANAKPQKSKQYHYSQTNKKVGNKKAKKAKYAYRNYKQRLKKEVANVVCIPDRHGVSEQSQNCYSQPSPTTIAHAAVSGVRSIGGGLAARANQYVGQTASQLGLPRTLWCADFMNMLVGGTDRRAISYARRGTPAPYGCTDCVAVLPRRGGNHVGIVQGYDEAGNPIIISGNHNRQVGVGVYSKQRVIAYRYI
jgi:uncharacterized protein (TIGR02594 family)